ncbi:MAG: carboxypeptidase regulatory-like domain-containing protein [Phycisphaerales bacterium]|nr:carboxypeptidase regulatory-like domain-containing protein [Phycisphaerales bacterium]
MMINPARVLLLAALALGVLFMTGCAKPRLEGVVIPGPIGVVAVIDGDDTRLDQVGIPEARVRVSLTGNRRTLVDTMTDEEGRFSVPTSGQNMARGTVRVIVEADGYARVDKTVPLRSFYRSLYITMVELHGSRDHDGSAGDGDEEQSG